MRRRVLPQPSAPPEARSCAFTGGMSVRSRVDLEYQYSRSGRLRTS